MRIAATEIATGIAATSSNKDHSSNDEKQIQSISIPICIYGSDTVGDTASHSDLYTNPHTPSNIELGSDPGLAEPPWALGG